MKKSRRDFIRLSGMAGAGLLLYPAMACRAAREPIVASASGTPLPSGTAFELPPLGYDYSALEPFIDAMTMEIHYSRHHAGYVKNLNAALADPGRFAGMGLEDICRAVTDKDTAVRNNAGGHWNHTRFWAWMRPGGSTAPSGVLLEAINRSFGSMETFRSQFAEAAKARFGSGWAWLCADGKKELFISSTPNQDNPLMSSLVDKPGSPILGIDVWEHAYYLKYQNKRAEYIQSFMNVVNWDEVAAQYAALPGG
ncbi:MAG: superoxide dismutase [Flavobacteriales bacterium]|jgi:Fe-Mn family superoxide dismutase